MKRLMKPSLSFSTTPYSIGTFTFFSNMVAAAPLRLCSRMASVKSKSHIASPLIISTLSSACFRAFFTPPAVPIGLSSTAHSAFMPNALPSPI